MKIIKEEIYKEFECPKCGKPLDFDGNEDIEEIPLWYYFFPFGDISSGNGWFACEDCNKRYLIENYAKTKKEPQQK